MRSVCYGLIVPRSDKYPMLISELKPIKPLTPDQQRIAAMKANAKRAGQAVRAERARQQQRTAQQTLATVQKTITAT